MSHHRVCQRGITAAKKNGLAVFCPRRGKLRHPSRRSARKHLKGVRATNGGDDGLVVYRCVHCHGWHVGHDRYAKGP